MTPHEKHQALDALFDEWIAARPTHDQFAKDGIVDPDEFGVHGPRVLFVLKETSTLDFQRTDNDLRKWLLDETAKYGPTWITLARWAEVFVPEDDRVLAGSTSGKDTRRKATDALRRAAVMNISKFTSNTKASGSAINAFAIRDADFIRKQIDIIDPEVIVACGVRKALTTLLKLGDEHQSQPREQGKKANVLTVRNGKQAIFLTRHPDRASADVVQALAAAWSEVQRGSSAAQ